MLTLVAGVSCSKKPFLSAKSGSEEALQECRKIALDKDYDRSNECLEVLKSRFAGTGVSAEADLEIADNHFRKNEFLLASETYLSFIKLHPTHEKTGYAYYKTGLCYLKENPKAIDRDQKYLDSAIQYFEVAISRTSGDLQQLARERWVEARTRIALRHEYIGRYYYRVGEYLAAIPRFHEIVTHYPGLGLDERALYFMGDSFRKLGEKQNALEILGVFDQHFPNSKYRKKLASKLNAK